MGIVVFLLFKFMTNKICGKVQNNSKGNEH